MPKNTRREKTVFSEQQIKDLFSYIENDLKDPQIACWLALAIASGSRFAELLRFTTDIIDINNLAFEDIFLETLKPIKTKGRGTEGKMLYKYIIKDIFLPYYDKWLIRRNKIMKRNKIEHNFIFINENGEIGTEGMVRGWIKTIDDFLGVPFYAHSLRHYSATLLSKSGLPNELIQEIFGWASSDMPKLYIDIGVKDRKWKELANLKEQLKNK
jgi:integrase